MTDMAKTLINKKLLNHLAELTRIELTANESEKLLKNLKKILEHFEELKNLNTEKVEPMMGGASLQNVFRADEMDFNKKSDTVNGEGRIIDSFPEVEKGFLKVPKIFE